MLKVHTILCQAQDLALPHSGKQRHPVDKFVLTALNGLPKGGDLILLQGMDFFPPDPPQVTEICRIAPYPSQLAPPSCEIHFEYCGLFWGRAFSQSGGHDKASVKMYGQKLCAPYRLENILSLVSGLPGTILNGTLEKILLMYMKKSSFW